MLLRVSHEFVPVFERTTELRHPDVPGELIVLTVLQRVTTTILGEHVTKDISGSARGSISGRELPPRTWTAEMRVAFDGLASAARPRPAKLSLSGSGYALIGVLVLAFGALVFGLVQPWVAAQSGATHDDAKARAEAVLREPVVGEVLLIGEPTGASFRWYRIDSVDDDVVELVGTATTHDMTYAQPEPQALTFDGPRLRIPRADFGRGGTLFDEGRPRLVVNAGS